MPLLHVRLGLTATPETSGAAPAITAPATTPSTVQEVIDHLSAHDLVLTYDPQTRTLETDREHPVRITI